MTRLFRDPLHHLLHAASWLLLWSALWPAMVLAAPPAPPATWTVAADGQTLHQSSPGLVWERCVLGMRWNGRTCVGQPLWLDHAQAMAMARQRAKADGLAWRLPHLGELQQLARQGVQPGQKLLPESSQGWVWSGTIPIEMRSINPYSYDNVMHGVNAQNIAQMRFLHAWVVNTATGEARKDVLKRTPMFVRLVRRAD